MQQANLSITQKTLAGSMEYTGIGVSTGTVTMRLQPGMVDSGINFVPTDLDTKDRIIQARWDHAAATSNFLVVSNEHKVVVGRIQYLLASLRYANIDNAVIEIDGPEVPVTDDNAERFIQLLRSIGTKSQKVPVTAILMQQPLVLDEWYGHVDILPSKRSLISIEVKNKHSDHNTGVNLSFVLPIETFRRGSKYERMFDLSYHIAKALSLGIPYQIARRKILNNVGMLALAEVPILGHFRCHQADNLAQLGMLRKLFNTGYAWSYTTIDEFDA